MLQALAHLRASKPERVRKGFLTSMKTNFVMLGLALSMRGGLSHEEQTYMRRLIEIVRQAVKHSAQAGSVHAAHGGARIEAGLAAAEALLAKYRGTH